MASAAVAVAKLTIPNKAVHIKDRDELNGKYKELGKRIDEFPTRRDLLKERETTHITLDNAVDVLSVLQKSVDSFNNDCQTAQAEIDANNQALRDLLQRIKTVITQEEATKAAKEAASAAAAAKTAEKAAALEKARDLLQVYIMSLQTQLKGINDNNLNDIDQLIQNSANTINQYDAVLDASVSGAGEAISQATREAITAFKTDTGAEVTSNTPRFNALNQEFGQAKKTIVNDLTTRIQVLQGVARGAGVTADAIQIALDSDKQNPINDKNLGEIKDRAARLAAEFGTKATEFATRKAEIEGKIEEDKKTFQEKQKIIEEYQGIMSILDSQEVKDKEAAIQENITKAQAAEKAAEAATVNKQGSLLTKSLAKTKFGTAITGLNTSIFSLETELNKIKDLPTKLKELQQRSANIQPPPVDIASIQTRLDELNAAKTEYKRLNEAQEDLAAKLKAETPVPPSFPRPNTARPVPVPVSVPVLKPGDAGDSADNESTPEEKRKPGRKYSIFIPTPFQKKQSTSRVSAAAAPNPDNTEDTIDPTVLEIFVYEDDDEKKSGASEPMGASGKAEARDRVGIIQRGGEPPKVAKIIKVNKITPEIKKLFLSFESPNKTLTPEFLNSIEENKQSTEVVDTPKDIDTEMANIKRDELIQNDDTTDFLSKLGQKASHQTTIEKLMIFLDTSINDKNEAIRITQNGKTYKDMYLRLWRFMEYTSGSIATLRSVFENRDKTMAATLLAATQSGINQRRNDLTWISAQDNSLLNILFMEFSKCYNKSGNDDGTYSLFLEEQVMSKGSQKYRFMLNWIILIAFHWYYIQKEKQQHDGLIDCCEFIEHLYHTFIGWMEKMDTQSLKNVFTPVSSDSITYKTKVNNLIDSDFKTDASLKSLITGIRHYLCSYTNKGKRGIANPKKLTKEPVTPRPSAISTTPVQPPPQNDRLFTRTGRVVSPGIPVPLSKVNSETSPQSGSLTDRPVATYTFGNLQKAIKDTNKQKNQENSFRNNAIGVGEMGPLQSINTDQTQQVKRPSSASVIQTQTQSPRPPTAEKTSGPGLSVTQRNRLHKGGPAGGHKRTRKHRPAPASAPASATRRHRDHSSTNASSSHKRTRRRRASIRT